MQFISLLFNTKNILKYKWTKIINKIKLELLINKHSLI